MPAVGKGYQRCAIAKEGVSAADECDEADLRHQWGREVQECWDTPEQRNGRKQDDGQGEVAERAAPAPRPADSDRDAKKDERERVHVLHEGDNAVHQVISSGSESVDGRDLAGEQADELRVPLPAGPAGED